MAKTSGGKGLQLYAAVAGLTSQETSDLAKGLAERLEQEQPGLVVSRMTKALRPGKVLIDWSQNNAAKTTVAPYSLRAQSQPTVSAPVGWDEVEACKRAADLVFTADEVVARVADKGDCSLRHCRVSSQTENLERAPIRLLPRCHGVTYATRCAIYIALSMPWGHNQHRHATAADMGK